jgi:hypothetical protein
MAVKVEKNLLALGKGDWIGSSRASNSKAKTKSRVMNSANLVPRCNNKIDRSCGENPNICVTNEKRGHLNGKSTTRSISAEEKFWL